ncbi:MAG TPA: GNAT family N-acetyltransferase [Rhodocyclaceae bacterium]|nr:GNAT family N-acetyltransferase [Rhodocyclaceae bacterium]
MRSAAVELLRLQAGKDCHLLMRIWISISAQCIEIYGTHNALIRRFPVSTAANGAGEVSGSYRTPRGRHVVRAKIGGGVPENTVFVRRRPTGEIWTPELASANPGRDWILTRILWLSGKEPGLNRLGEVDTMRRYIYIHGSPDAVAMGVPGSIGCIRMRNRDIVELFDLVPAYTSVDIVEYDVEDGDWTRLGSLVGPVRESVFVREQGVPADMEYDDWDLHSLHAMARGPGGEPIGTGRLLPDGHIGRVAVLPAWRGKGVGEALMTRLMNEAMRRGNRSVVLNSQASAIDFYRKLGFEPQGPGFMEAGIPHQEMVCSLSG